MWRTDGQTPRQRGTDVVVDEILELRRRGFRFVALADDNFYPVTLTDLAQAERQNNLPRLAQLKALRAERFELMDQLSQLPSDMVFFTQITMEAAEDPEFLEGDEAREHQRCPGWGGGRDPEGLKDVFKGFNDVGEALVQRLQTFRDHGVHVLGSFIFGLPSDRPSTFAATADIADRAGVAFAQFVMLTPFPGTIDFAAWEKRLGDDVTRIAGIPITRHWLIPQAQRPKVYTEHPVMSADEIRTRTQGVWDQFYSLRRIWSRSRCTPTVRGRVAFVLISKLYRQMYANTGIATDSARVNRANRWARLIAKPCRRLFTAKPLPTLQRRPRPSSPLLNDRTQRLSSVDHQAERPVVGASEPHPPESEPVPARRSRRAGTPAVAVGNHRKRDRRGLLLAELILGSIGAIR